LSFLLSGKEKDKEVKPLSTGEWLKSEEGYYYNYPPTKTYKNEKSLQTVFQFHKHLITHTRLPEFRAACEER